MRALQYNTDYAKQILSKQTGNTLKQNQRKTSVSKDLRGIIEPGGNAMGFGLSWSMMLPPSNSFEQRDDSPLVDQRMEVTGIVYGKLS